MKLEKQKKIWRLTVIVVLALAAASLLLLPDQVVTKYSNVNGVVSVEYGSKIEASLTGVIFAAIGSLILRSAWRTPVPRKPQPDRKPGKFKLAIGWLMMAWGVLSYVLVVLGFFVV